MKNSSLLYIYLYFTSYFNNRNTDILQLKKLEKKETAKFKDNARYFNNLNPNIIFFFGNCFMYEVFINFQKTKYEKYT